MSRRVGSWGWAAAVLVLLLATFLRFHRLGAQSFWNDEGNSARLSERSISLILEGTASDIHPPLYYLALRGWRELVGDSEFGLRAFSAFAGLLTVAGTMALMRGLLNRYAYPILIAGLFVAVNPALVYYSQEARMYALLGLWAVLSTWLLLRWQQRPSRLLTLAYALTLAAGLYTHYFFPAVIAAHGAAVSLQIFLFPSAPPLLRSPAPLPHRSLASLLRWLAPLTLALLLYLPWLPIFLDQFGDDAVIRPSLTTFVQETSSWLLLGGTVAQPAVWAWLAIALVGLLALLIGGAKVLLPLLLLIMPLLLMWIAGTMQPSFYKFLVMAAPMVGVLLGMSAVQKKKGTQMNAEDADIKAKSAFFCEICVLFFRKNGRRLLPLLVLLLLLLPMTRSLQNLYSNPAYARADYRAMATRITAESKDAGVILNAANQWEAFTYYYGDEAAVYPLPKGRTQPTPEEIDAALQPIAAQHNRLYALFWGEAQRDPQRLIERWLDVHAFKATDEWYGDVRFVTYAVPAAPATEMETAVHVPFGEHIMLQGYTLRDAKLRPGDIVQITLFWQTAVPLNQRYKVFLHVLNEAGELVAQRDSEPGGGLALTSTWQSGETVVDNHGVLLPAGLADGRYQLVLGLYDIADPDARLPVQTAVGPTDRLPLATLMVRQ